MKVVIVISSLLLTVLAYRELAATSVDGLSEHEMQEVLTADSKEGAALKASFSKVLPQLNKSDQDTNLNQTPSESMRIDEILESMRVGEADLAQVRDLMFKESVPTEKQYEIFEIARNVLPPGDFILLSRDVLAKSPDPTLFHRAANLWLGSLSKMEAEVEINDMLMSISDEQKSLLREFAISKGFLVP